MHVRAGFFLKTHDFLQPLERPPPPQSPPPQAPAEKLLHQHALPGGIGTFSISHGGAATAVKQEQQQPQPFALWGQPDPRGTPRHITRARPLLLSTSSCALLEWTGGELTPAQRRRGVASRGAPAR